MFKKKIENDSELVVAKRSISVAMVFGIVGVLFLTLCYAMFFFRYSELSPFYKYYLPKPPTETVTGTLEKQISSSPGASIELKITENQIDDIICLTCDTFPLKKAELSIKPDGILVKGKTSNAFWGINVEANLKPKIENEKLAFDLTEIKAAGVAAPPKITDSVSPKLKELFNNILPANNAIVFREAYSMVGYILIVGAKK